MADLNCNFYEPNHCYAKLIRERMSMHRLVSAFDLASEFDLASSYTRYDTVLTRFKGHNGTFYFCLLYPNAVKSSLYSDYQLP